MKKFVITGGPGIGKTTVIEILASKGYKIVPESARIVIEEGQVNNTDVLPWIDLEKFQNKVTKKQLELENTINDETTFLDRGIIDGYAYSILGNTNIPDQILKMVRIDIQKFLFLNLFLFMKMIHKEEKILKKL